ncbi:MAG: glutathione S-transferase family protein [Albidovulum sp.]
MYILHYAPDNASLVIRLALEEIGAPFRTELVDRAVRAQDSAAYRAVNPTGLIPALETPQGALFETAAILLWLSETHATLAPQPGSAERGAFLKWLFFTSNTLHADIRLHFYPENHAGSEVGLPGFREAVAQRILRHLGLMEAMACSKPSWFSPDHPSVLTLYLSCLLRWLALYPLDRHGWFDLGQFPALHAVACAMQTRPSAQRAAVAEGLGVSIFAAPDYANPPEGRVL